MNTLPRFSGRRLPSAHFTLLWGGVLFSLLAAPGLGEQPIPQIEPGGPGSYVTSLAFSPDGRTLYAAGWDKTVQVWRRPHPQGPLQLDPVSTFRVPLGPGLNGAINALAVSPDGRWLAVGGRSVVAAGSGFRDLGRIIPATAMTREMKRDQGVIHIFDTRTREVRTLTGHYGEVLALTFASNGQDRPYLASAARERDYRPGRENQETGVVRFWDVLAETPDAQRMAGAILPVPEVRPVLSAWRSGNGPKDFRVALAWGDRKLRLWEVATNRLPETPTDGANDNVMAPLRQGLLLAGQTRGIDGRLGKFSVGSDGRLRLTGTWGDAFRTQGRTVWAPRLAAAVTNATSGEAEMAAVVLLRGQLVERDGRNTLEEKTYELRLVRLDGSRFGQTAARVDLWSGEGRFQPTLAVSPQGIIAVGGNEDQTLQLFDVESLLQGGGPVQQLRGNGLPLEGIEFVRRGNDGYGLKLQPRPTMTTPETVPLLFDVDRRRLDSWPSDNSWRKDSSTLGEWRVQLSSERGAGDNSPRATLVIHKGSSAWQRIRMEPEREVTAHAFTQDHDPPLLAVATRGMDEVQLTIYEAEKGQLLRFCTAHTLPIHSLHFSSDGRLLASAGDDGIACVWSLTDLPETYGKRGAPGVELEFHEGNVRVRHVDAQQRELRAGDLLLGQVLGEDLQAWESLGDAYEAAWRRNPGDSLTVRRLRGGVTAEVSLPIGQGTDERKPLFSLFVARNPLEGERLGDAGRWGWIAFTPLGPFDSSNIDFERYLGWHINTGDPRSPTSFARADQYRDQYRKEGLVSQLWQRGRLAQVEQARPLPRPTLTLLFPQDSESDEPPPVSNLLRTIPESVELSVFGIASAHIDAVTLWIDDQEVGKFDEQFDHQWTASLAGLDWSRGSHRIRASLVTREPVPQVFQTELEATYFPPAPEVAVEIPAGSLTATEQLDVAFRIGAARRDSDVNWTLVRRNGDEVTTVAEGRSPSDATIRRSVLQRPGANRFELIVSSADAGPEQSPLETTRRTLVTNFQPAASGPTLLTIQQAEFLNEQGTISRATLEPGSVVSTSAPFLRVSGTVVSSRIPEGGTWKLGEQDGTLQILPGQGDAPTRFETRESIALKSGSQTVTLQVDMNGAEQLQAELEVHYEPELPRVNLLAPFDGQEFIEGREEGIALIKAELSSGGSLVANLLRNGQVIKELPIDSEGGISGSLPLVAGENRLQIRLQRVGEERFEDSAPVVVVYRFPPRVTEVHVTPPGESPFVDMSVQGTSLTPPSQLEVFVADRRIRLVGRSQITWQPGDKTWNVTIPQLPLRQGKNSFHVFAQNQDGHSLQPQVAEVEYTPAPPPLAEIQFLNPATESMTIQSELTLVFLARSRSPLRQIRILHDKREVHRVDQLRDVRANREGWFEREARFDVKLTPGTNFFEGYVVNDGGEAFSESRITYHFVPVRMEIVGISGGGRAGQEAWTLEPLIETGADVVFDRPLPSGRVQIHGRVIWESVDVRMTRERMPVRVWINGFSQAPVQLSPYTDDSNMRHFTASVVLNKESENIVELDLPKLSTKADCRLSFSLDCDAPVLERRLHLAIIGVGVSAQDTEALEQRALAAFQGVRPADKRTEFHTPAFRRGWVYGPVTGERVNRYRVQGLLDQIRQKVNGLSRSDPMNDVVVIYYEGGEIVYEEEQFFLTTKEATALRDLNPEIVKLSSVGSELLSQFFASMGGAHLMFLDVVRGQEGLVREAVLPNDRRTALLRFAWLRDAESPDDASLIVAVRDVLSEDDDLINLNSIVTRIGDQFEPRDNVLVSRRFGESLIFQPRVPPAILDLIVGQR